MARTTLRFVGVLAQAGISVLASVAFAEDCTSPVGTLVSVQGLVEVQRSGATDWRPIGLGDDLCAGDVLRIGERSRIEASLVNQVKIRGDQNTTLKLISAPEERISWLDLFSGGAYFFSRQPRSLNVNTPFVNAAVEGTEFQIRVVADHTDIGVFNGTVLARNSFGEAILRSGRSSIATAYAAPTDVLTIRPFDAVQWALYFPPVLASPPADLALPMALREAIELADQGRTAEAFQRFAKVPDADRDATFYLYRAQTLLSVGRVDEAEGDLRQVLARDPDNASAYGVLAVIAVSRNEQADALRLAQHAVELAPSSAAAKIALSYAEQSHFQIAAARDALQQAVADEPENALAWARLSELWLMLGWRDRAVETAKRARDLAPDLGRVQTVLGFAALAEFNTRRAAEAFRRAIELDQASPLPRFGLGLAAIRDGNLREGRADIESAVLLDPNNSLLRSYLGKAYFSERTTNPLEYFRELIENFPNQENKHAAEQYALAKQLDPNDPTPWFYDAIRKQTENRPVEALQDLQKSIELNDNRAVYRSRELLDQDRAARGASLGRIYDDLGFQRLGVNEATYSLTLDPANASAHRFLSDIYASEPRHEIARVSEQLQAQLLQDVNINPVQPSLAVTDFNIITTGGPARPGFNEFTRLFESNGAQLNATGIVGNQETFGNEAVISGLYDRYSVSAGQFHYQTDGFRDNNGINADIYNFFAQAAVTPDFNIQTELRRATSEFGDSVFNFDPELLDERKDAKFNQTSARIGARYALDPASSFISSVITSRLEADFSKSNGSQTDQRARFDAIQSEAAYLHDGNLIDVVSGAGYSRVETDLRVRSVGSDRFNADYGSAYLYSYLKPTSDLACVLGVSFDKYSEKDQDLANINPKFGLTWDVMPAVRLRLAAFRSLKPVLVTNRTIQPTQVAGFNQFFDDVDGTEAWRYGGGVDVQVSRDVSLGVEASARQLQENLVPILGSSKNTVHENRDEQLYRSYVYWAITEQIALSAGFMYDNYDSETTPAAVPPKVETWTAPISIRYFDPSGLFGVLGASYVFQEVNREGDEQIEGDSNFFLLDAALGYRLPERRGITSIQVVNLLNQGFKYQDDSFREFGTTPKTSHFVPERTVTWRITLNF